MTTQDFYNIADFARRRGVSHTAVQRAIADGRLPKSARKVGVRWRIDARLGDEEWAESASPANSRTRVDGPANGSASNGEGSDYRSALVREKGLKSELAELALEERRGRLVDVGVVKDEQFEVARRIRNRLLELPDRLADELAAESDAVRVRGILDRELREILCGEADVLEKAT